MTTLTYKNIDNKSFKQVKEIIETEFGLDDDSIVEDTTKELTYHFKFKQFLTVYNLELNLYKDIKSRIKINLSCLSSSMRIWIWLTLPLFVFTFILWFMHFVSSNVSSFFDKHSLSEALDKHFL